MSAPSTALAEFVSYVGKHLTGDEKGEAADFLDHLFRALGHEGVKQAGATRETHVAKKGGGKGKNYARPHLAPARSHRDEVTREKTGA